MPRHIVMARQVVSGTLTSPDVPVGANMDTVTITGDISPAGLQTSAELEVGIQSSADGNEPWRLEARFIWKGPADTAEQPKMTVALQRLRGRRIRLGVRCPIALETGLIIDVN